MENEIGISNKNYKAFTFNLILTMVYCTIIYIQSSYPALETLPEIPYMDKFLHFSGYAFLGWDLRNSEHPVGFSRHNGSH